MPLSPEEIDPSDGTGRSSAQPDAPPPEEPSPPVGTPPAEPSTEAPAEDIWKEDYEDVIEPSPEEEAQAAAGAQPKKRKKSHWAGIVTVCVIIILLMLWTVMSPKVLHPQGMTYVNSTKYADLGNFTGNRSIWAGDVVWGVSVSGPNSTTSGKPVQLQVLVTKVSERPGNFFFRGTAISISNCTLWDVNGTYIAKFTSIQDPGFGKIAVINATLPVGEHSLYVSVTFTEYEVMRLGFIPLENVQVENVYLEPIEVVA